MNPFRRPLIAGNWKMNAGGREACALAAMVADRTRAAGRVDVVVAPPFTAVAAVAHEIEEVRGSVEVGEGVGVAGQNMHAKTSGAFTGEVAPAMLRDAGATWVIIGHSERRQLFGETDEGVGEKVRAAFEADLQPIACVGETLEEREAGQTLEVVLRQLRAFMQHFASAPGVGVVAYEPVWAIGTGRVAKPEDAQAVHAKIREVLAEVSEEVAEATRILYGGSVKADNASGLLDQVDIDGALVGGASLDSEGFGKIVDAAQAVATRLAVEAGVVDDEESGDEAEDEAEDAANPDDEAGEDAGPDDAGGAEAEADTLGEREDAAADEAEDLSDAHAPGPGRPEPKGDPADAPASTAFEADYDGDDDLDGREDDAEDDEADDDGDGDEDDDEDDEPIA